MSSLQASIMGPMTQRQISAERVLRHWNASKGGVKQTEGTMNEMKILIESLPRELAQYLQHKYENRLIDLNEIYLQLGQVPECMFLLTPSQAR